MFRLIFPLLYIVVIIYIIMDVLNSDKSNEQKLIWILLVVFFPIIGSIVYYLRKNSKI